MTNFLRLMAVVAVIVCCFGGPVTTAKAQKKPPGVVSGKVLVKFAPGLEPHLGTMKVGRKNGYIQTGISGFDALTQKHKATGFKRVFPYNPQKEAAHRRHGLHLWYELTVPPDADVTAASREFKGLSDVAHAEPVRAKTMITPGKPTRVAQPEAPLSISSPVNDPLYFLQWHYDNDGATNGGIPEADINLPEAWKIESGNPNVIVSVHDLGVDVTHKDLAPNIWVNTAEKNGRPGVDDDYNGYIDDINGYDFSGDSGAVPPGDHATHVAGTIAAVNNNGIGVAGIAGGNGTQPGVKVMTAKILDGMYDNIAASFVYAADNGAVISQNSWSYVNPNVYDQAVLDAIDYFIEEAGNYPNSPMKGGIVIFAAGNSASQEPYYPSYYDRVLSVASLGRTNKIAYYSNYGTWVEIAAPGGDQFVNYEDGVLSTLPNNQYGFFQGTSMACPHVSGIAALVVSHYGGKGYTADNLRTALLTATHDIDAYNPDYKGLLGRGYIDAALALANNQGVAPQKVADLSAEKTGQDYINLLWSPSADTDDGQAAEYEIIYGTDSLGVAQRRNIKAVTVAASAASEGKLRHTLGDLYANTKYFVAAYAKDRWANKSAISTIIRVTTTDGPGVALDRDAFEFTFDVTQQTKANDAFNIINTTAGDLRWKGEVRQKSYTLAWNSLPYPIAPSRTAAASKIKVRPSNVNTKARPKAGTTDYNDGYAERAISYVVDEYYGAYMIGEEDTSIPNSAATKFVVNYADGFNMTNLRVLLNHNADRGDAPFIVEIYQGEIPERKNLVYAAAYQGYSNFDTNYNLQLEQQLFFAQGSTFWVAIHMPAGHLYPFGVNLESEETGSDNSYISFDVGQHWTPLAEAIGNDDRWAWIQVPVSSSPGIDAYVSLSPVEGTVEGKSQQNVAVVADATRLINGQYNADIVVKNNDWQNSLASIPVSITVTGQKPVLSADAIIDFGGVFRGRSKTKEVTIRNTGYGNFMTNTATVNNASFEIESSPYKIGALGEATITIKYAPQTIGAATGVVTLTDANGNSYQLNVAGVGIAPAAIAITPPSAKYSLALGDEASGTFTIKNTGNYPLQFFMPKYSDGAGVDYVSEGFNTFGYTYRTTTDGSGLAFAWDDIASTGTEVGSFFNDVVNNKFFPVKLGFDFPIFNQTTDHLMITRYGVLTIDDQVNVVGNPIDIGSEYMPYGYISALNQPLSFENGGKLYYQAKPGKFIIQYDNVASAWDNNQHITFQVVINDNGNVQINYKDISLDPFNTQYIDVAIEDPDKKAGYLVASWQNPINATSGFSVELVSPGRSIIQSLSVAEGTLAPGATIDVDYTLDTDGLSEGSFWQNLVVVSNDPVHPGETFKVLVDITSGGVANVSVAPQTLDLGEVFIGDKISNVIAVTNGGSKAVTVNGITSQHGYFTLEHAPTPFYLKPKTTLYVNVGLTGANVGTLNDVLNVTFDAGAPQSVAVTAAVVPAPDVKLTYAAIDDVLEAGTSTSHTVAIQNTGGSTLQVVPSGTDWVYAGEAATATGAAGIQYPANTYHVSDNRNGGRPVFAWENLRTSGKRIDFAYMGDSEEYGIDLPFTFPFYGQAYKKLYINPNGLVYFTPNQVVDLFPANTIPVAGGPDNFIAPFWTIGGAYYSLNNEVYGVFYKIEEDVVTIQYANLYNVFGMGDPFDAQVLIYRNGTVKFQYDLPGMFSYTSSSVIGVENADGTEGVRIAAYQSFVEDNLAVLLTPANRMEIAAGETRELTLVVDAHNLMAGDYHTDVRIQTNVPGKTDLAIPVHLTVNGKAQAEIAPSLDLGSKIIETTDGVAIPVTQEFYLTNTGSARLDVSRMYLQTGDNTSLSMEISSFFGAMWVPVPEDLAPGDVSLIPKQSMKFRIGIAPALDNYELYDAVVIESNREGGVLQVPVHVAFQLPPVLNLGQDAFTFLAPDKSFTGQGSFSIDNKGGQSPLVYHATVQYRREATAPAQAKTIVSADAQSWQPEKVVARGGHSVTATAETYNRTLAYGSSSDTESFIGFGYAAGFISATKFNVPADGFTLSHVQSYYASGDLASSDITVQIYLGSDMATADLLTGESYTLATGKNHQGLETFTLAMPQTFYPGESFFVVIGYPLGAPHPQGLYLLDESHTGTSLYSSDGVMWSDITSVTQYAKTAWYVNALEKTYVDNQWLTLNAEKAAGTIAIDGESAISFNVSAATMDNAARYAEIRITSNVPGDAGIVTVDLKMNQAPRFGQDDQTYYTDEQQPVAFTVPLADAEGDAITLSIPDAPDGLTSVLTDAGVAITYKPGFLAAGAHTFNIHAKDAGNRESIKPVTVVVYNVNRAPAVVDQSAREYAANAVADEISIASIIADPDTDDRMIVTASASDETVVDVLSSESVLRIRPKKAGSTTVTVTLTDPYGATASAVIPVTVNLVTAIETTPFGSVRIYPNPTAHTLYVTLENATTKAEAYAIRDVTGRVLQQGDIRKNETVKADVNALAPGLYILVLAGSDTQHTFKFIKQ